MSEMHDDASIHRRALRRRRETRIEPVLLLHYTTAAADSNGIQLGVSSTSGESSDVARAHHGSQTSPTRGRNGFSRLAHPSWRIYRPSLVRRQWRRLALYLVAGGRIGENDKG